MASTTTTPRISVILPCRNAAAFLHPCIASLSAQTFDEFEVIAVDDGSTDGTRDILNDWRTRDARVCVLENTGGLVGALNAGLASARGELIARMDADDIAWPARFEWQLRAFDVEPELTACGTRVRYFPREAVGGGALRYEAWLNSLIEPHQLERDLFVECPIAHPTLMVRAPALRAAGGYADRGWPEDYDLILRLFACGGRLRNVPHVLLDWRERPERASRTDLRYSEQAFRRCKVHYLIATRPRLRSAVVWGAGPVGKGFAREFVRRGVRLQAFVDIDPRKIGQMIHGAPVLAPAELAAARSDAFVIAAVSGEQPRSEIRAALTALQLRELDDFVAVA